MASQLTPLADVSRQPLQVGTPPIYIFDKDGARYDRDIVALSVQLRIAEALERIANALNPTYVKLSTLEPSPEDLLDMEKGGQQS